MAVSAVQNDRRSHNMSYITAAGVGALAGYSLKWALPITPQEKDERYSSKLDQVRKESRAVRKAEIENLPKLNPKPDGLDEFISMHKNNNLTYDAIKKLKEPTQTQVMTLYQRINKIALDCKTAGKKALVAFTKSIRPSSAFVLTGLGLGIGIAFVHNVINNMYKNDSSKDSK